MVLLPGYGQARHAWVADNDVADLLDPERGASSYVCRARYPEALGGSMPSPGRNASLLTTSVAPILLAVACAAPQPVPHSAPAVSTEPTTRTISFTTTAGTYLGFDLSPDAQTIVVDLLGQLWRIPADGGDAVPLTNAVDDAAEDLNPNFSPDGRWIAFQGDRGGREGLWIMAAEGGEPRLLSGTEPASKLWRYYIPPSWSADGRTLAFSLLGRLHLHHVERDTTIQVEIHEPPDGLLMEPAWLPDGRLVARIRSTPWHNTGGPLWLIDPSTGTAEKVPTGGLDVFAPAPTPDGRRLAYFAEDDQDAIQLWIQPMENGDPEQITRQEDVLPLRGRWTADGAELVYSAGGGLWRVAAGGGEPREIPFTAHIEFEREEPNLPPVRFPEPGSEVSARGHMALALSPDGSRIALIALGRLWVWSIGEEPRPVTDVPSMAEWLSWSPRGDEVAWSAGLVGAEDIFATHLETGDTRQITNLAGRAERPAWSPDGQRIAFFYWPGMTSDDQAERGGRFAVIPAAGQMIRNPAELLLPETEHILRLPGFAAMGQVRPVWSPASDAIFAPGEEGPAEILRLEGDASPVEHEFGRTLFLNWASDGSLVFVQGNQIGTGTDIPMVPGAIHLELEELVASGLSPMEALLAATSHAAHVIGAEEEIGTIEVGKWADLILLDADPLEDIRNTRRIWKVVQGGRVVDREALLGLAGEQQ